MDTYAQTAPIDNPEPAQYTAAAKVLARWFLTGTAHHDMLSATPLGRLRSSYQEGQPFPLRMGSDWGFSYSQLPLTDEIRYSYRVMGTDAKTLPEYLNFYRFHLAQALSRNMDIAASALVVPDIELYGFGASLKYNFWRLGPLFTSARINYSNSRKSEFFESSSFGADISQSLNLNFLDIYAGLRYYNGEVKFTPSNISLPIAPIEYGNANALQSFAGLVIATGKHARLTAQANFNSNENFYLLKFSMKLPTIVPMLPQWAKEPHY